MKIASWNVNSVRVREAQVADWLQSAAPDVLGLQETKVVDEAFPRELFESLGYRVYFTGQKTYNGVALIVKSELGEPLNLTCALADFDDDAKRYIAATVGGVRIVNVYVPNGQSVDSDKYHYKLGWLEALKQMLARDLSEHEQLVVMGDFNIAPEDTDVHDPIVWEGHVLVSPLERAALQAINSLGLEDTFRLFPQEDKRFSWWDYRAAGFRRNAGLRIDLLLASKALATYCEASDIDTAPRKLEKPSDHAPVWAEFAI